MAISSPCSYSNYDSLFVSPCRMTRLTQSYLLLRILDSPRPHLLHHKLMPFLAMNPWRQQQAQATSKMSSRRRLLMMPHVLLSVEDNLQTENENNRRNEGNLVLIITECVQRSAVMSITSFPFSMESSY